MTGRLLLLALGLVALAASLVATCHVWHYRELAADVAWLADRDFPRLTVITVGTGSAYENPSRLGPATAIGLGERIVLVDAGRGVAEALRAVEIPVAQPSAVLLTSLLPENTVGLDDLLFTGWLAPRGSPLRLVGPAGTRTLAEGLLQAHAPAARAMGEAIGLPEAGARFEVLEIGDGWSEESDGLRIRAAAVGDGGLPQLAYRFEAAGRAAVVSGSGPDPDRLAALARGAQLLVAEGFHRQSVDLAIEAGVENPDRLRREADGHTDLRGVARAARDSGVGTLVLTRLRPPPLFDAQFQTPVGEIYPGPLAVASDGEQFTP
jgi:ribonuclease Z